jgi:long-chain acyl-CoA synthetase
VAVREKRRGIWQSLSWAAFADEAEALAAALRADGLQRGDKVGLLSDNRPRMLVAMAAVQWLGGVVVPLYPEAGVEETAEQLRAAGLVAVFAENQEQVDKLLQAAPRCPALRRIVFDQDRGMRHYQQPLLRALEACLAQGRQALGQHRAALEAELARGQPGDPAALFFTSGTTGPAKAVLHSHAALIDRMRTLAELDQLGETDVLLAYLSPAWIVQHAFAYVLPLVTGACVCCPESSETMLSDLREMGPSLFLAPPRVLETLLTQLTIRISDTGGVKQRLYEHYMGVAARVGPALLAGAPAGAGPRAAYAVGNALIYGPLRDVIGMSRVRVAYAAGEAIGPDLLQFYRAIGINLKALYGSTETGPCVAVHRNGQVQPESVGAAAPGVEVAISPQGEVLVRSPGLFLGYHTAQHGLAQALGDEAGWFHTGDAGWVGPDGQLRVIDRFSDIGRLHDGSAFSPKLLENKLKFSPYIREAVAFGHGQVQVGVFINIDLEAVGNWADRQGISYTGHADLAANAAVYELIARCIGQANAELAADPSLARAQIHRFVILHKMLEPEDGELTRMRKPRRELIAQRFAGLIQALHEGRESLHVDAAVRYDDGRMGVVSADLRICQAPTFPARPALQDVKQAVKPVA